MPIYTSEVRANITFISAHTVLIGVPRSGTDGWIFLLVPRSGLVKHLRRFVANPLFTQPLVTTAASITGSQSKSECTYPYIYSLVMYNYRVTS